MIRYSTAQNFSAGLVTATGSTTPRSLANRFADVINARDYGAAGNGTADDTVAIQAAVTAAVAAKSTLFIPPGNYLITSAINVLGKCKIFGAWGLTTIILGTQNQNGFVIGDGTSPTRTACLNTTIDSLTFLPKSGVTAFASGACIYRNYVAYVDILNCYFYGSDDGGVTRKLWNGVLDFQVAESNIIKCDFAYFLNNGWRATGSATVALNTITARTDYCEFTQIAGDAIFIAQYCQGITINFPVIYKCLAVGIHIAAIASTGGVNFFINQPDIENDGTIGIYAEDAQVVQVTGGWIGGKTAFQTGANGGNHLLTGVEIDLGQLIISAPACTIAGCNISGDNATQQDGITVNSTATYLNISGCRIQQYTRYGINCVSQPPNLTLSGLTFKSIGTAELNMPSYTLSTNPPVAEACTTDISPNIAAASALPLRLGYGFIQVTGATAINSMSALPAGTKITIQSGSGGITINNGANILMQSGTAASVPAFFTIAFSTDGSGVWFEIGRSFFNGVAATAAVLSNSATSGVGYSTGAGGTVSQSTSKATGVSLSKVCGTITMNAANLAADTSVSFTLTNTAVAATDFVLVQHDSVGTLGAYICTATPASGSASVTVHNATPGALAEAIVLRFVVIKAVTS